MSKLNKNEKKMEKKIVNAIRKPKNMMSVGKYLKDMAYTGLNTVARGINKSHIGIHTPYGSLGLGMNGLIVNPEGVSSNIASVTQSRSGKRNMYFTGQAPRYKGYANGLRVVASQVMCNIVQQITVPNVGSPGCFIAAGSVVASFRLSPDELGGQCATDARNYNRFRFTQIIMEYIPSVPVSWAGDPAAAEAVTTGAQNFVLGYSSDGAADAVSTIDYSSAQNVADNSVIPVWTCGGLVVKNLGRDLYYSETDLTTTAGRRATNQGLFLGRWNTLPIGTSAVAHNRIVGELVIHYVLDLYDRASDYGFTITFNPDLKLEKEMLIFLFQKFGSKLHRRSLVRLKTLLSPDTSSTQGIDDEIKVLLPPFNDFVVIEEKEEKKVDLSKLLSTRR